jgi:hypothetical protein
MLSLSTHRPTETGSETVTLPRIPWSVEYDWAGNGSASETKLNSLASGRAYKSQVTFQSHPIQNIYAGTHLENSPQKLPNKTGTKIYLGNLETWSKTDTADVTYEALMPSKGGFVLTVPNDQLVTADVVMEFVLRTVAMLTSNSTSGHLYDWLARLLNGSTNPTLTINT